jgi:hypothetical protein
MRKQPTDVRFGSVAAHLRKQSEDYARVIREAGIKGQ